MYLKGVIGRERRVISWLLSLAILCTSLCFVMSGLAQSTQVATSSITDNGISLSIEVAGLTYKKNGTVIVKYELRNLRKEDVFVIVPKTVSPGYSLSPQRVVLSLEKVVFDDHYFEMPKLERLKPGKSLNGTSSLQLAFLKENFKAGPWFLGLSMGYLDSQAMIEITDLQKKGYTREIARPFERFQKIHDAGPIEITLSE